MDDFVGMLDDEELLQADGRNASCFFTGHRTLPEKKEFIFIALKKNISYLYSIGVREFHAGGAIGFDTIAATAVIDLKRFHPDMKLILNLPFRNQTKGWSDINVERYEYIKKKADAVVYTYDADVTNRNEAVKYLLKRNRDMVDCSKYGIAYYTGKEKSGTGYTVFYAKQSNCEIVNLYE